MDAGRYDASQSSAQPPGVREDDSQTSAQPYRYKNLPNKSSIRLLEILPSPEGEIYCTLKTASLDDVPVFDALSYSWANPITIREEPIPLGEEGQKATKSILSLSSLPASSVPHVVNLDPGALIYLTAHAYLPYMDRECGRDRSQTIFCDSMEIPVTETLFEALLQLRRIIMSKKEAKERGMVYLETLPVSRSKYLWIDAVCINQDDIDERNAQVPLMSRIFACAQYVFAWIGEFDTLGESGFEAIINMGQRLQTDSEFGAKGGWDFDRAGLEKKRLYALTALFSRLWFRRAWVVQEAVYARRLYLWSGSFFLDWWLVVPTVQTIQEKGLEHEMANLTSSLIRRQPTAKLGKKLAAVEAKKESRELPIPSVTYVEILGNIKAAIVFVNGVIDMKRRLEMPCYRPDHAEKGKTSDKKIGGFAPKIEELSSTKPTKVFKNASNQEDSQSATRSNPTLQEQLESKLGHLSEPFAARRSGEHEDRNAGGDNGARINVSFVSHEFSVMEPIAPTPTSLFSLMTKFRGVGASDPRDNVFAFLNLATQTPDLKANYRMTVQSVFTWTTKNMLHAEDLTILSHVQDPSETKVCGLPSWVPDFSVPLRRSPFVDKNGSCPYSASGKSVQQLMFYLTTSAGATVFEILALHGYLIDTVAEVARPGGCYFTRVGQVALNTPSLYTKETSTAFAVRGRAFLRTGNYDPEVYSSQVDQLKTGTSPRVEVLWRTMIGNICSNTYPAPVSAGFGFSDWVAAHIHHANHFHVVMSDHLAAVAPNAASEELKTFKESQQAKFDTWAALHKDELGAFISFEDATAHFESVLETSVPAKELIENGYTPEMNVVRFLPNPARILALKECIFVNQSQTHPDRAQCPILTSDERARKSAFETQMREVKDGRRMLRTKSDSLGMGPKSVQEGDEVWVLPGAKVPFVLRPVDGGKEPRRYHLVGEAYLHGYMDGEAMREGREQQIFGLV